MIKYFSFDTEVRLAGSMANSEFAVKFPGVKGVKYDGYRKLVGNLEGLGQTHAITRIIEVKRVTDHVCDARCRCAKGGTCECSCGGRFHGIDR